MLDIAINTIDHSREMENYLEKTVTHTLLAADKLYIGYHKPINRVFLEMSTPNVNSVVLIC